MSARHRLPGRPTYPTPIAATCDLVDQLDVDQVRRRTVAVPTALALIVGGAGSAAASWTDGWSSSSAVSSGIWSAPEISVTPVSDQQATATWPALGGPGISYSVEQRTNSGAWTALPSGFGVLSAQVSAPGGSTVEIRVTGSIDGQAGPTGHASIVLPMAAPVPVLDFSSPTVAKVSWPAVSGATRYRAEVSLDGGAWQLLREDAAGWQEWSVHAGQEVAVRVRADNGTVFSPWSTTVEGRSPFTSLYAPIGTLDGSERIGEQIRVSGWVMDRDGTVPAGLHVYVVAGTDPTDILHRGSGHAFVADVPRPDVAAAYPGSGPRHGYDVQVPAPASPSTVCLYGIDFTYSSANTNLGCVTL